MPVNTTSCVKYHLETSYHRGQLGGHPLDWANQPEVFKAYPGAAPIPLPREVVLPDIRLSSLLKKQDGALSTRVMDLHRLSTILRLTHSLTAKARQGGGSFYFRSAASAGALYPNELYAAVRNIDGLHDGLYHFSIAQHGLVLLRKGDATGTCIPIPRGWSSFCRRSFSGVPGNTGPDPTATTSWMPVISWRTSSWR
ncbi:MAG: hypothetical protein P8165_16735 [Deltaproteobacteria bacterium]